METAVQVFAVVNLLVIGVSHIARPRAWIGFFESLKAKGEAGVFVVALISLAFGSILVAFHNVWSGIPIVLTLLGWSQVLKAALYFTWPAYGLKKLRVACQARAWLVRVPGVAFVVIAGLLLYHLATRGPMAV
ncbi:MAG: hypothetical protein AAGA57_05625 [Planctomycetota bacterium]